MTISKQLKSRILGRWVNVYYFRGYARFLIPLGILSNVVNIVGILFLIYGNHQVGNFWIWVVGVSVAIVVGSVVFGRWDYSEKGTRIYETLRYMDSDAAFIKVWSDLYPVFRELAEKNGIQVSENFQKMETWLLQKREAYKL
jgi:hypothetical protein